MPNTSNDDVIIVGSLSDKELRDSIDKLVDYVGDKTTIMAGKFDVAMEKMKSAMKDFAITQKVSVDLMQDAWKQMSASFDAMLKAQQNATSSGNNSGAGGGNSQYADNTVGHLQEIIALEEKRRKEMTLGSDALRDQNKLIEEQKAKLKGETTSDQVKAAQAAKKELQEAFTMPARGLADAEKKLQQLQSLSAKFQGKGILDQTQWNRLNAQIQTTQEKIDKLRQKKPTSIQDVLGMDESSVDAIAKKMAALKNVTVDPQNTAQVKQLGDEYQRLKRLQAELMGQNIQMTHSNNYLAQSFGYIRNRLVYAMTLGAITSFTKQVYEIRGQYELLERSLGVLVNSFERGSQIFQELNQMAIESPFTLMELAGAAKQLTAYNFAANEVVDTTRRLADISAALGVPMERLTYNLGQIRAQTVLTARDARDFANAGLPIVASLAEHFTELEGKIVTTGDVYDRMSKKMVSYSDVMAVLNKMTDEGGKFFEFQAKQAETLRVQMANLNLAWNNMLNDIGKSNQGLLTLPVSGLKALFQNWQSIDRVLKSMLVTFGLWKALQVVAIRRQWAWASATGATAKQMGFLANAAKGLFASMKALALNPWTWVFVGIQAIVDLAHQLWNARSAMHELNQEIRDNANEASNNILNYLNNKGNQSTRQLAQQNKLTTEQGEKAWESISEQIKQSALSANSLLAELQAIPDINERVATSFDYAERIQKAQAALQDLKEDSIKVNQDYTFLGIGEEGLVTDLQDYANEIIKFEGTYKELQDLLFTNKGTNTDIKVRFHEFDKELDDTAESINNFIRAYNITDPLQINEILERVRSQIKAKNPEIKGEAAKIFDISLDQKMAELTNGAVDRNASLWNMFMERLVHRSHHAFQDINDDWIKSNEKLSPKQQAAVDANLQYFKDSMPYAYQAVSEMVADASKLKIHIGIAFNVQQLSDFQKEVNQRISNSVGALDFGGGAFLPTNNDNLLSWVKTQQQAIKSLREENKKYALDTSQWAQDKIKENDTEIQQRKNLLDLFHQEYEEQRKGNNKKTEDVVAEALKQEIQLIREMQSNYEKLRKAGVSNMDAIDLSAKGYEATILRINSVLQKFGIDKFNASNFAGKDVRNLLQALEQQRAALLASGKVKTSSLQALDVEIQKLTVDAKTYDMKKVTDGLNSELGKIKDEYELAVELDANPELGGIFADMMGISKDKLAELPRTFDDVLSKLQTKIDDKFGDGTFVLKDMLNAKKFDDWVKNNGKDPSSEMIESLKAYVTYANKVRQDETKKQVKEWDKLLEKYAEYEYKRKQIEDTYRREMETARKNGAGADILKAITRKHDQSLAQLDFEEYQRSPEWITATGNIADLTASALGKLIEGLEKYKKEAKNLDPKQIKKINQALSALYKQQRKGNPFHVIADAIAEAKERMDDYTPTIKEYEQQIKELEEEEKRENGLSQDKAAKLKKLREELKSLKEEQAAVGKVSATTIVDGINSAIAVAQQASTAFSEMADALGGKKMTDAAKTISNITGILEKGGQGAAIGAQIGSGYGAIIGAAAGLLSGIVTTFADSLSGNAYITEQVEDSVLAVKRLENAYKLLEDAADEAYGIAEIGAKRATIANKELQLVELKRQLQLEESRKEKNRDESKIVDLKGQIIDLELEIKNATKEIVNDLLDISNVGDAAETLVASMIKAFKNGEDYMKAYEESFEDMVDNMIMKAIVSKVIGDKLNDIFERVEKIAKERADQQTMTWAELTGVYADWANLLGAWFSGGNMNADDYLPTGKQTYATLLGFVEKKLAGELNAETRKLYEGYLEKLKELYTKAALPTPEDVESIRQSKDEWYGEVKEIFESYMDAFGIKYGQDASQSLSALQQGIQGVTEDTAGAIEGYMNIVAQRVFEQNLYLQEIRDHLNNFDLDVQLGTLSQMLLQLQQSYQVQQNIEMILNGVLTPNGRAIVVELNS